MKIGPGQPSRTIVVLTLIGLLLATGGLVVLLHRGGTRGPQRTAGRPHSAPTAPEASVPSSSARITPMLAATDDPSTYARQVVTALFDLDPAATTRSDFLRFWRAQLPTVVYEDAAAKGLTLQSQNTDAIDNLTSSWIPTQAVWNGEATQHAIERIAITSVTVPDYWVNAVATGTFRDPGLRVERVMGVVSTSYDSSVTLRAVARRPVVIDLALLCGPTQPGGCRLLAPQQAGESGSP